MRKGKGGEILRCTGMHVDRIILQRTGKEEANNKPVNALKWHAALLIFTKWNVCTPAASAQPGPTVLPV